MTNTGHRTLSGTIPTPYTYLGTAQQRIGEPFQCAKLRLELLSADVDDDTTASLSLAVVFLVLLPLLFVGNGFTDCGVVVFTEGTGGAG